VRRLYSRNFLGRLCERFAFGSSILAPNNMAFGLRVAWALRIGRRNTLIMERTIK